MKEKSQKSPAIKALKLKKTKYDINIILTLSKDLYKYLFIVCVCDVMVTI